LVNVFFRITFTSSSSVKTPRFARVLFDVKAFGITLFCDFKSKTLNLVINYLRTVGGVCDAKDKTRSAKIDAFMRTTGLSAMHLTCSTCCSKVKSVMEHCCIVSFCLPSKLSSRLSKEEIGSLNCVNALTRSNVLICVLVCAVVCKRRCIQALKKNFL
jgi:hypothetical protein